MSVRDPSVIVVEPEGRGGLLHYSYQLCAALAAEGLPVEMITSRHAVLPGPARDFQVVKLLRLWDPKPATGGPAGSTLSRFSRGLRHYREWARLVRHIAHSRADVVQLGDLRFAGDVVPVLALRRVSAHLVDVCHNVEPFRGGRTTGGFRMGRLERHLYRLAYDRFDRIFVHYEVNRRRFLDLFPGTAGRVGVVPMGNQEILRQLDEGRSPGELRDELGLGRKAPVVLFLGTLTAYKGVDLLLQAVAAIADVSTLDLHCVVAGLPLRDFDVGAHREMATRLGIGGRVHFVPRYLSDGQLGTFMRLASVVALPYREGFQSGVLLLAQTFGVPVVASRIGSFPEVIDDGVNGLLHEPGDSRSLADALVRVLQDDRLRRRLAQGADRVAHTRHSWRRVAKPLAEEYRRMMRVERSGTRPGIAREGIRR